MGLLSYINTMEQKGPGLLALAEQYEIHDAESETFYSWCKKNHFAHAALFQRDESVFYITKAVGFDAESIALSYSTKDFWEGTLVTNGDWQSFSQGTTEIASFNQFFSEELLSTIEQIHFIKLDDIILLVIQDDSDFVLPENADSVKKSLIQILYTSKKTVGGFENEAAIQKGLSISNAHLYFLSVKTAVDTAVKDVPFVDDHARQKTVQTVYNEIFRICSNLFQRPNCCELGANGEIKIAFFAKDEVDEELMQFHLANMLSDLVGRDATKGIILLAAGICPNVKGTMAFLLHG